MVQHGTTLFGKHLVDRGQKEQLFVTVHFLMEIMIVAVTEKTLSKIQTQI